MIIGPDKEEGGGANFNVRKSTGFFFIIPHYLLLGGGEQANFVIWWTGPPIHCFMADHEKGNDIEGIFFRDIKERDVWGKRLVTPH